MQLPLELLGRCWFLTGPTASGKSSLALELADRLNAEIVSLDSMTLYRGMNIGTAKPSWEEQARVPHHLIDILDPHEEFSVAEYLSAAEAACRAIVSRGRSPLFVGGTALYLRSLLRGVFEGPPADWTLRHELQAEAETSGAETLHRRLAQVDAETARRLSPNDLRRVIRALEVHQLTGVPLSAQQREQPLPDELRPPVFWLSPPRDWLHQRINTRVDQMFVDGLVEEVRGLLEWPDGLGRTARQGLGYKEVIDFLESGGSEGEMRETLKARTRQFAKRQMTWFRNLVECQPLEFQGDESAGELAARLLEAIRAQRPELVSRRSPGTEPTSRG